MYVDLHCTCIRLHNNIIIHVHVKEKKIVQCTYIILSLRTPQALLDGFRGAVPPRVSCLYVTTPSESSLNCWE